MSSYWIDFNGRSSACIQAESEEDAIERAKEFGEVKQARPLPYPARPQIGPKSDCPEFCYSPAECAGRTACPKNPCCSN